MLAIEKSNFEQISCFTKLLAAIIGEMEFSLPYETVVKLIVKLFVWYSADEQNIIQPNVPRKTIKW